jgi:hypothetical protein
MHLRCSLYIADTNNNVIRKVSTSGIITTVAGNGLFDLTGDGGKATAASVNFPQDLVVGTDGRWAWWNR